MVVVSGFIQHMLEEIQLPDIVGGTSAGYIMERTLEEFDHLDVHKKHWVRKPSTPYLVFLSLLEKIVIIMVNG
jgi:uncharacterized protein (UPF0262 family)